jgi:glutamyl-tRNA synthetase
MSDQIVTRFAPSPTGYLHIGGARTALFNWLFARHHGGKFLLRIEDTDRARSTPEATKAIYRGLKWLGLDHDGVAISQFDRKDRHAEVAHQMLARGAAYKCFATQDEIESYREAARAEGKSTIYRSPWRDAPPETHQDLPYVIRVKAPLTGATVIRDKVQGDVTIQNSELDDMICLRSDATPTYMLAVVVDDHDMGVTHVIRGDDHLNNAARQMLVYHAMDWSVPVWAHIPLIHGEDGKKLSKRHGAMGVEDWQKMGYPAAGMRNYLARLGWSHGDDEFFTDDQAIAWFDLDGIGRAPARFDLKKLDHLSGQHIAILDDAALLTEISAYLAASDQQPLTDRQVLALGKAMYCLKDRAKTYPELLEKAHFCLSERPMIADDKAAAMLDDTGRTLLMELTPHLQSVSWDKVSIEAAIAAFSEGKAIKFAKLAGPMRAALAGRSVSPSVYDMLLVLGQIESLARLNEATT